MTGLVIHEWLERHGGAEKVVDGMMEAFPDADLCVLWNDDPDRYPGRRVYETPLAKTPLAGNKKLSLPLMPVIWRTLPKRNYDWLMVSQHAFAHQAHLFGRDVPKLVYACTVARYLWVPELDPRGNHPLMRAAAPALKMIDRHRAKEAASIASDSYYIRDRVADTWERDSIVIYPPVDVTGFAQPVHLDPEEERILESLPDTYVLGISRFIPYKRLDLVIKTGEAVGQPVVLAGGGPLRDELAAQAAAASVPVQIVDSPSTPLLRELYRRATVFVFPPIEDFGIAPVEALAAGTPVIANAIGGASETVQDGLTGVLVHDFEPETLRAAFERASGLDPDACRARAQVFSTERFVQELKDWQRDVVG